DQPPRLTMDLPIDRSIICTPYAVIPIRGLATDDYGVAQIAMRASAGEDPPRETTLAGEDVLAPLGSKSIPFYHDLELRELAKSAPESAPAAPAGSTPEGAGPEVKVGDKFLFKFLVTDNR